MKTMLAGMAVALLPASALPTDADGTVYILERGGHALRAVKPDGTIRTVAGTGERGHRDGPALEAQLNSPKHICVDPAVELNRPHGVCFEDGTLYVVDSGNNRILRLETAAEARN